MILVDVYVPAVDASYDFILDENAAVRKVIAEISGMISKKMKESTANLNAEFKLYSMNEGVLLNSGQSLAMNNVTDGCKLLLI